MGELEIFAEQEALDRVDNDKELFAELLDIFFQDLPSQLQGLQAACDNKNPESYEKLAHSMKSALGNLGAMRAHAAALKLELEGKARSTKNAGELFQSLRDEIEGFRAKVGR